MVIGETERFPELGAALYKSGALLEAPQSN
jgi:hypothetical protein